MDQRPFLTYIDPASAAPRPTTTSPLGVARHQFGEPRSLGGSGSSSTFGPPHTFGSGTRATLGQWNSRDMCASQLAYDPQVYTRGTSPLRFGGSVLGGTTGGVPFSRNPRKMPYTTTSPARTAGLDDDGHSPGDLPYLHILPPRVQRIALEARKQRANPDVVCISAEPAGPGHALARRGALCSQTVRDLKVGGLWGGGEGGFTGPGLLSRSASKSLSHSHSHGSMGSLVLPSMSRSSTHAQLVSLARADSNSIPSPARSPGGGARSPMSRQRTAGAALNRAGGSAASTGGGSWAGAGSAFLTEIP